MTINNTSKLFDERYDWCLKYFGTAQDYPPRWAPEDVVDQGITGYMHTNLKDAVDACLKLDRQTVWKGSQRWTWTNAWEIFKANLIKTV